jgi:hypothetical protein
MANLHNDRYDEIKSLLKRSKLLFEQETQVNVAKDIETRINQDTEYETADSDEDDDVNVERDKTQKYRISGGILALHGKKKSDTDITTVYKNSVEWSGKLIDDDLEFIFTIGEESGIYINGQMVKVDEEFLQLVNKMQQFYQKFKARWAKVLASRKRTQSTEE